ncbi:tetratricopeptide repeat protein [Candidatus Pelagibacter sp.]|nr:tetratricopeptide repeat protein [Candidatus Pelagibacter sp.]
MDQEVEIINNNTRIEKMKNFFLNYKKQLITLVVVIVLSLFGFFLFEEYKFGNKEKLANKYNNIITKFEINQKENVSSELKEIINVKDKTYSPLAFYFLLDNEMINSNEEINTYFDIMINDLDLDDEIKNLTIYKKGLFNSDFAEENELLNILNPVIKSESMWKPHALYLMAEYYFSKKEKQKSKEFFIQIISLENVNSKIKLEAQKRLRADFSE